MGVRIEAAELLALSPVLWVAGTAIAVLLADLLLRRRSKTTLAFISLTGLGAALYFMFQHWSGPVEQISLGGTIAVSSFGLAVGLGLLIAAALTALSAAQYGENSAVATGEFHGLVLFATAGGLVLVIANDLVTLFVALETMSLSVYALTGIMRGRSTAAEGAMKYFVLGAVASAFLLYGSGLLYGASGSLQLFPDLDGGEAVAYGLARPAAAMKGGLALAGVACVLVAILFKIGAVPFHAWVADAYEGAPAPSTGYMSVAVKAAAFVAFLKVVMAVGLGAGADIGLHDVLWWVAVLTMIVGNFGALMQDNPKRLLAYSGIAHTGYALIAIVAVAKELESSGPSGELVRNATSGLLFYMLAYAVTNLTAFAMLCRLERQGADVARTDQLAGTAKRAPLSALAMLIALISLAGIPLTGGFTAKVWVFQAGVRGELIVLVVLGLLTSVVSLYYYLRVVVIMYMHEADPSVAGPVEDPRQWTARFAMIGGMIGILILGLVPAPAAELMKAGAKALFGGA